MDLLEEIQAELKKVTTTDVSLFEPTAEVKEDEMPLGQCDEELKKLCVLINKYSQESVQALRASEDVVEDEKKGWDILFVKKRRKAEVVGNILFLTIRERFDIWDQRIRIRKGWQIVRKPIEKGKGKGIRVLIVSASKDDKKPEKE
jgi:hypothetical protein